MDEHTGTTARASRRAQSGSLFSPRLMLLLGLGALLVAACKPPSGGPGGGGGGGDGGTRPAPGGAVGAPCSDSSQCQGNVCLFQSTADETSGTGFCSKPCGSDSDCTPGWQCLVPQGATTQKICECTPTTEQCDGRDDDCDGIVDDAPATDWQCAGANHSWGSICENGACTCPATCSGKCVDTTSDPTNCGSCGHACSTPNADDLAFCVNGTCKVATPASATADTVNGANGHAVGSKFVRDGAGNIDFTAGGDLEQYHETSDTADQLPVGAYLQGWNGYIANILPDGKSVIVDYDANGNGTCKLLEAALDAKNPTMLADDPTCTLGQVTDSEAVYGTQQGGPSGQTVILRVPLVGGNPLALGGFPGNSVYAWLARSGTVLYAAADEDYGAGAFNWLTSLNTDGSGQKTIGPSVHAPFTGIALASDTVFVSTYGGVLAYYPKSAGRTSIVLGTGLIITNAITTNTAVDSMMVSGSKLFASVLTCAGAGWTWSESSAMGECYTRVYEYDLQTKTSSLAATLPMSGIGRVVDLANGTLYVSSVMYLTGNPMYHRELFEVPLN